MSRVNVLDASAVLAYLQQEKGQDHIEAALNADPCWLSTVNMCEVLGKLHEKGMPPQEAQTAIDDLRLTIRSFDEDLAVRAALLRAPTQSIGASLGDRACLALAQQAAESKSIPIVFTTEHAWTKLRWPFKIAVIR